MADPIGGGGEETSRVEDVDAIRRAYFVNGLSIWEIARWLHHWRRLIRRVIADRGPYQSQLPRAGTKRCRSLTSMKALPLSTVN